MAPRIPFRSTLLGLAALAASVFAFPSSALAQIPVPNRVWFVSLNPTGDGSSWLKTTTLDNALQISNAGDTIRVMEDNSPGGPVPYQPTIRTNPLDSRSATFRITKQLTVRGGYAGTEGLSGMPTGSIAKTVLDGNLGQTGPSDNAYHVVTVDTTALVVIDGFSIKNGNAELPFAPPADLRRRGGGILATSGAQVRIASVNLEGNTAQDRGGAIYLMNATATIKQVTIAGSNGTLGAGIAADNTMLDLVNSRFQNNGFGFRGGAMYLQGGVGNLTNCVFDWNWVELQGGSGGAIYLTGGVAATLTNCTFGTNYVQLGIASQSTANMIDNSTNGGGTCALRNSIIWSFQSPSWPGFPHIQLGGPPAPLFTAEFCDIQMPGAAVWPDSINFPVNTNRNQDPIFSVNTMPSGPFSLSLQPSSPVLTMGNRLLLPTDVSDIDNDGNTTETLPLDRARTPRVTPPMPTVAMGAFETPDVVDLDP
jgi:hypothetical protein